MSHFCMSREAPQVDLLLSGLIYEIGGGFDQHMTFQDTSTKSLNAMLMLHPSFAAALSGPKGSASGSGATHGGSSTTDGNANPGSGHKGHFADGKLYFGRGKAGPTYVVALIMAKIREVKAVNRGNFCIEFYLSTKGTCSNSKHHAKCPQHKWPSAVTALRESFEHQPYRIDAKALPEK